MGELQRRKKQGQTSLPLPPICEAALVGVAVKDWQKRVPDGDPGLRCASARLGGVEVGGLWGGWSEAEGHMAFADSDRATPSSPNPPGVLLTGCGFELPSRCPWPYPIQQRYPRPAWRSRRPALIHEPRLHY